MDGLIDTFSNRLNTAMRIRNIKATELSEKTGIAKSSLSEYINGKYEAKQDGVYLLAKALNVTEAWLMGLDVSMERDIIDKPTPECELSDNKQSYPLLGTVKGGYDYLASENIIGYVSIDYPLPDMENCYALKVTGDSMYPLMGEDDIIIIHKQTTFENGQTCIVLINGDEATVKNVFKTDSGIKLVALNPYVPPKEFSFEDMEKIPVKIIGIVKEVRNRSSFK